MLAEHRAALDAVIAILLERETISGEELAAIVRPFREVDRAQDPVPTLAMTNNDAVRARQGQREPCPSPRVRQTDRERPAE